MAADTHLNHYLDLRADYVWLDGELVSFDSARIHFLSPTLHYGLGVFAGMRCYQAERGPAVLRLEAHLRRFLRSIRSLGLTPDFSVTSLREAVHQTIIANDLGECYVRALMYLDGPLGLDLTAARPAIGIATWRWDNFWGRDAQQNGVRMTISPFPRSRSGMTMMPAKVAGQYVAAALARTLAVQSGFDEAIMLDSDGNVADTTGGNLFLVREGKLWTTPGVYDFGDITRESLVALAHDAGYEVRETPLTRQQFLVADEVFVCGTAAEVVHVRSLDHHPIGDGNIGPITDHLRRLYFDTARGRGKRSAEWLNYVVSHPMF